MHNGTLLDALRARGAETMKQCVSCKAQAGFGVGDVFRSANKCCGGARGAWLPRFYADDRLLMAGLLRRQCSSLFKLHKVYSRTAQHLFSCGGVRDIIVDYGFA
jgi:hypothetical protein